MTVFRVGKHEIRVWQHRGRWRVAVDDAVSRHWFMSEAQAAGAGLLRAQRLDRGAPSGPMARPKARTGAALPAA